MSVSKKKPINWLNERNSRTYIHHENLFKFKNKNMFNRKINKENPFF